jgi:putative endonuclease
MFYVYAIRSDLAGRIYIGQAENVTARIASHNDGQVRSTKKDRPWNLIAVEEFETRAAARWREHELKKSYGRRIRWIGSHRQ